MKDNKALFLLRRVLQCAVGNGWQEPCFFLSSRLAPDDPACQSACVSSPRCDLRP